MSISSSTCVLFVSEPTLRIRWLTPDKTSKNSPQTKQIAKNAREFRLLLRDLAIGTKHFVRRRTRCRQTPQHRDNPGGRSRLGRCRLFRQRQVQNTQSRSHGQRRRAPHEFLQHVSLLRSLARCIADWPVSIPQRRNAESSS